MWKILGYILFVLCSGCCCIQLRWNKLRIGKLDDRVEKLENGSKLEYEDTLGIRIKWFPDLDFSDLWLE